LNTDPEENTIEIDEVIAIVIVIETEIEKVEDVIETEIVIETVVAMRGAIGIVIFEKDQMKIGKDMVGITKTSMNTLMRYLFQCSC